MKEYLLLQYTMTNRTLRDAGIHPVLGYLVLAALFVGLSFYIFQQSTYAPYVFALMAVSLISRLSETRRNEFLKICFGDGKHRRIRMIENGIAALPFVLFLCSKQYFLVAAALGTMALLMGISTFSTSFSYSIPTPFGRRPFEFTVGFRNTFYLFIASYALIAIAITVDNFNLGIVALLMVFVITLSYYSTPEDEYYVWSHSLSPNRFLLDKLKTAMLYATLLAIPPVVALVAAFTSQGYIILAASIIGYAYLACMVLAKYSAYPKEMSLAQGLLLALCLLFPPALIIIIPYFFTRSANRLQHLLK